MDLRPSLVSSSLSEKAIYEQAREALMANADRSDILAFSADGRGVFQAEGPFGGQTPSGPQFDVWQPVFSERRPVVSDVFAGITACRSWPSGCPSSAAATSRTC